MKNKTKRNCKYYNWGNNPDYEYRCPREYGARCEKFNTFFSIINDRLEPNCFECEECK